MKSLRKMQIFLWVLQFALTPLVVNAADLSEYNVYTINGIFVDKVEAINNAEATDKLLFLPPLTTKALYNDSSLGLLDFLEAYRLAGLDGGQNDTTYFWDWLPDVLTAPTEYQQSYTQALAVFAQEFLLRTETSRSNMLSDYNAGKAVHRKNLILSHSEGNYFSNWLVNKIAETDSNQGYNWNIRVREQLILILARIAL